MTTLFLDLETFCETPINHGTHRYAEGAEILLFAYAIDDGPVRVLETFEDVPALLAAATRIVTHNSAFDRTVLRHAGFDSPLAKWDDTMVRALAHSLPGSLGQLCELLKVPTDKAKGVRGKELIQLFCKPRPKNMKLRRATRDTHPAEWAEFVEYARLDIEAMREIDTRLPRWNWSDAERDLWHLDQRINDRGFAVDLPLAEAAITAVADAQARLAEQAQQMTDGAVQAATQRDALLAHVLAEYGVALPDMQKSTLERRVADPDLPEALRDLLAVRLEACTTSTSKYKALVRASSSDGRLRGTLQFCGASRTGRWAGRLFQPQNLCRQDIPSSEIDRGIDALKAGCAGLIYG